MVKKVSKKASTRTIKTSYFNSMKETSCNKRVGCLK